MEDRKVIWFSITPLSEKGKFVFGFQVGFDLKDFPILVLSLGKHMVFIGPHYEH